jgi:Tfp pilus assembly protein PilN
MLMPMRTNLNLSRRPFKNRRLFWIAIAAVFFVSIWFGLWVTSETTRVKAEAEEIANLIKAQEGQVKAYLEEQERLKKAEEQIVISDQDAIHLASARQLIASRAFSWNKLIGDIERFVPKNAKVTSIQVSGASTTGGNIVAEVEIKAVGRSSAQLTEMMASMDKSGGLFEVRNNFSQEAALETGEIPFMLRVAYVPGRGEG